MIFDHPDFDRHEQVVFCHDPPVGLRAIIAIHSTVLGPAAGGCRMHPYASEKEALTDVLRLSKGMTYKNSVAGLPLGGGKCVIIADPKDTRKPELLRMFASHVQSMNGRFWTAIDVGVGPEDADILAEKSDYIFARASQHADGFYPSSYTAYGGFIGIRAAAESVLERTDLAGLRVAVQGLGATGFDLCRRLTEAKAHLVVADVRRDPVDRAIAQFGATPETPDRIHAADVDIFAPCAMGAVLNDRSIPEIKARIICGVANNQLEEDRHAAMLLARGIAYVPDYVVNAGGMMGASTVIFSEPSREASIQRIDGLHDTILSILNRARAEGRPSSEIADDMAMERIKTEGGE
ncbi:MAG: Glu/Leu/Phe/Val dehydrogenase dimerization domain-containing protein [Pseudomonadota bacterium]